MTTGRGRPPASGSGRNDLLTDSQLYAIRRLGGLLEYTLDDIDMYTNSLYLRPHQDLSRYEASVVIGNLSKRVQALPARKRAPQATARIDKALEEAGFKKAHAIEGNQAHTETWLREDGASIFVHWRGRIDAQ